MPRSPKPGPSTTSIERSRTVKAKLRSAKFQEQFSCLREIQTTKEYPSSSSRGRGAGKQKSQRGKGVRLGGIGGSELTSSVIIETNPLPNSNTRSVSQTCQPKSSDFECQIIPCQRCDHLGHDAMLCKSTNHNEQTRHCLRCTVKSMTYSANNKATLVMTLCHAHQQKVQDPDSAMNKDRAAFVLKKVNKLVTNGQSLPDAIKLMGLSHEAFQRMKMIE